MEQVWFELHRTPSEDDLDLLESVLSSWFMIGRLGGYNAMNLQANPNTLCPFGAMFCMPACTYIDRFIVQQAFYRGSESISFMEYDQAQGDLSLHAFFHDMGSLEHKGTWCRCW